MTIKLRALESNSLQLLVMIGGGGGYSKSIAKDLPHQMPHLPCP